MQLSQLIPIVLFSTIGLVLVSGPAWGDLPPPVDPKTHPVDPPDFRQPPIAPPNPQPISSEQKEQARTGSFAGLDTNGDGTLSRSELAFDVAKASRFDALDADRDGKISEQEWKKNPDATRR
ncbi:EF-hand domain-containing protein [Tahibacter amnicola]|uniref:EF-hand domain-containing protein n=1 Tax=Tahibacter amnicola TaxID=2976241 RepID=A0ABY6B8Z1_9GAMM|nr:EF-hand domain-containing protein [Tahibacter amnicola]UXI66528.1 EF-hand domain-containing protein [Tahibacter amnicola]